MPGTARNFWSRAVSGQAGGDSGRSGRYRLAARGEEGADATMNGETPLWQPDRVAVAAHPLTRFTAAAAKRAGRAFADYRALHAWSVDDRAAFWDLVWDFCGVIGDKGARRLVDGDTMPGARFFPDAQAQFRREPAETRGRRRRDRLPRRGRPTGACSAGASFATWSRASQQALAARRRRDRRPGRGPCCPTCPRPSPHARHRLARRGLVVLLARFRRRGRARPLRPDRAQGAHRRRRLLLRRQGDRHRATSSPRSPAACRASRATVVVPFLGRGRCRVAAGCRARVTLEAALAPFAAGPLAFAQLPFDHPLYILFSSGTTGDAQMHRPSAGGTLLQHLKEHRLHSDIGAGDRVFYFTTCGWMMWNWLVSGLASRRRCCSSTARPSIPDRQCALRLWPRQSG